MDTWETHYRSIVSESGASRSLSGFDQINHHADLSIAFMGNLMANEKTATLNAAGVTISSGNESGSPDEDEDSVSISL